MDGPTHCLAYAWAVSSGTRCGAGLIGCPLSLPTHSLDEARPDNTSVRAFRYEKRISRSRRRRWSGISSLTHRPPPLIEQGLRCRGCSASSPSRAAPARASFLQRGAPASPARSSRAVPCPRSPSVASALPIGGSNPQRRFTSVTARMLSIIGEMRSMLPAWDGRGRSSG
jgi:hypothetical protein